MKRYLPFIIIALVAVVTIGSAAMLYHNKARVYAVGKKGGTGRGDAGHVRGDYDAPVTLEEFGDFQCPPCALATQDIDAMEREYRGRVRILFRNFPLAMHAHAAEAAYAAEAAARQGHFWEMHDLLYRQQDEWSKASDVRKLFVSYARLLGLNVDRFEVDMQGAAVRDSVNIDQHEGMTRGVTGTPTIFINNAVLPPSSFNRDGLRAAISNALKGLPEKK